MRLPLSILWENVSGAKPLFTWVINFLYTSLRQEIIYIHKTHIFSPRSKSSQNGCLPNSAHKGIGFYRASSVLHQKRTRGNAVGIHTIWKAIFYYPVLSRSSPLLYHVQDDVHRSVLSEEELFNNSLNVMVHINPSKRLLSTKSDASMSSALSCTVLFIQILDSYVEEMVKGRCGRDPYGVCEDRILWAIACHLVLQLVARTAFE